MTLLIVHISPCVFPWGDGWLALFEVTALLLGACFLSARCSRLHHLANLDSFASLDMRTFHKCKLQQLFTFLK